MKRYGWAVWATASCLLISGPGFATPVEREAVINEKLKGRQDVLDDMARLVKAHGYKCDSISAARPMVFSRGFVLVCNGFAYEYELEDKGGNWRVTVK